MNLVDHIFSTYDKAYGPGAAVMVFQRGEISFAKCFGLANVENRIPITPQTNFRLASLTKQFTATAILLLQERGLLSYETAVEDFLPELSRYTGITVRHLLNHTSGLPDYEALIPPETQNQVKDADVLELLTSRGTPLFKPGEKFRYSNSGYAVLALLAERVTRQKFGTFTRENIFQTLGMNGTVAHEAGRTDVANRAYGYTLQDENWVRTDQSVTSAVLGDGGIYSSIENLAKWEQSLQRNSLLRADIIKEAFSPGRLNDGNPTRYGFGWQILTYRGQPVYSHSGSTIGFRNFIARFPSKGLTLILLTNRNESIEPAILEGLIDRFCPGLEKSPSDTQAAREIVGMEPLDPPPLAKPGF